MLSNEPELNASQERVKSIVIALTGCEPLPQPPVPKTSTTLATPNPSTTIHNLWLVTRVSDGDTISIDGKSTRLIGIDTPETVDPRRPDGCYGKEASDRTKALLPNGTAVRIEYDVERTDRYGRQLAYVWRASDGLFINLVLVQEGYAKAYPYGNKTVAHRAEFAAAEVTARAQGAGLWSACPR